MIDLLTQGLEFMRHLDEHLQNLVTEYQALTYLILALIIFCETGLVVTPFLPGDSLLFAAGAVAAGGSALNVWLLIPILIIAAILGDNTNYFFRPVFREAGVYARLLVFEKRLYHPHPGVL